MDKETLDAVRAIIQARIAKTKWADDARKLRTLLAEIEQLRQHTP